MSFVNCTIIDKDTIHCNNVTFKAENMLTYEDKGFWIYLGIYVALVLFAGLMSGLTMGLLSLDLMTLKIMKDGGSPKEKKQAEKILPIVERHHLLLVTLLLANAAAVESMPIFLDRVSSPIIAIVVSVTAVLIFGEVVPQAVCTRHGVAIGAALSPIVYLLIGMFCIISWPLSKLLDCLLGKDHGTFYRRGELKVLVDLHASSPPHLANGSDHEGEESLTVDEVLIIKGALDMKHKTVKDAMLPLDDVYMLDVNSQMDHKTMKCIVDMSHSRLPVYEDEKTNIISVLIVKTLICLDPEDCTPVRTLLHSNSVASVIHVDDDMPLYDLLNIFQTGKGHLAIVNKRTSNRSLNESDDTCILEEINSQVNEYSDIPEGTVIGIITLEDVIEELIQEEIIDETDIYVDIHKRIQVARAQRARRTTNNLMRSKSQPAIKEDDHKEIKVERHISRSLDNQIEETTDENAALLPPV
ncbi:uncharacterized protein LOC127724058 isoform X2 [Mytilus californianus]|uniref:uncharacterized protein LOC127724058 isoform X2 n=1 Tax=Mytilus californianus TaxID=6549 RepID=UPI002246D02E|nr:uncharacterized protein LOC127724058 isoform X2 [Mytilus californianus]